MQGKISRRKISRRLKAPIRLALVIIAVAALTWILFSLIHANSSTAGFLYLLLILGLALQAGRTESITASLASMFAYNYFFLPPVGTLGIADPQNWVAFFAFLFTAIAASHLSSKVKDRADDAFLRERELKRMYEFNQALMLGDEAIRVTERAAQHLAAAFGAEDVCVYSIADQAFARIKADSLLTDTLMREVSNTGEPWFDESHSAAIVPIRWGGRGLGSLGVAGGEGNSEVVLYALTQLIAADMERANAQRAAAHIEAARHGEQLKSVLLDALAHEFKTPLTSVKAAVTSMLSQRTLTDDERELATVIDEEADRLTTMVSDSIELARVGSGTVQLHRETWPVRELIESALRVLHNRLEGRDLTISCFDNLPGIDVDRRLIEVGLRQLLTNAVSYSHEGSPIEITAAHADGSVVVSVSNAGISIPAPELDLLFEKFYRGKEVRNRVAGSGLGLSITRDIVAAHGGQIWAKNLPNGGVQFAFSLPVAQP